MTSSFNAASWSAYMNIRTDGTIAVRLPPIAGWCPTGKTVIFEFNAEGITKAIEAIYKHQHYVNTPYQKADLPPHFIRNIPKDRINAYKQEVPMKGRRV